MVPMWTGMWQGWFGTLAGFGRARWTLAPPADLAAAFARHALVLLLGAAFAAAVTVGGRPARRWLAPGRPGGTPGLAPGRPGGTPGASRTERICLATGLGWSALAMALFALALTGLYARPVLLGLLALLAGAGLAAGPLRRAALPDVPAGWKLPLLLALPAAAILPLAVLPVTWMDTAVYHLAAPERFLRFHRFATEGANMAFHMQLMAEFVNVYALLAHLEPLTPFLSLPPFLAGVGALAAWIARSMGPGPALAGAVLALLNPWAAWVLLTAKNDLAVAGMSILALVLQLRGRIVPAFACWGLACTVKVSGLALAGQAWLWHEGWRIWRRRSAWRPDLAGCSALVAPAVPWMLKGWIMRGDPLWPLLSRWWPGAMADPFVLAAIKALVGPPVPFSEHLATLWHYVSVAEPGLLLLLPAAALAGSRLPRELRLGLVLAAVMILGFEFTVRFELERLSLPAVSLLWGCGAAGLAALTAGWARWGRAAAWTAAAALAWGAYGQVPASAGVNPDMAVAYLLGALPPERYLDTSQTTLRETQRAMASLGGAGSLQLVEESRIFRWPVRVMMDEAWGRPAPWLLTREAASADRVMIRLHQRDIRYLGLNVISNLFPTAAGEHFEWTPRQIDLWREVMSRHAVIAVAPRHCDHMNGGYYIWRFARPRAARAEPIFYLPGIKQIITSIVRPYSGGSTNATAAASCDLALAWAKRYPDDGEFRMLAGFFGSLCDRQAMALELYTPLIRAGMVGENSLLVAGQLAMNAGRLEEALDWLERGAEMFNDQREISDKLLAFVLTRLALKDAADPDRLPQALARARRAVALFPDNAGTHEMLGFVLLRMRRPAEALAAFRTALQRPGLTPAMEGEVRRFAAQAEAQLPRESRVF